MSCMCGDAECPSCGVAQGTREPTGDVESASPLPWGPELTPPNGAVIRDADGHVVADELLLGDAVMICVSCNAYGGLVNACERVLRDRDARVHLRDELLECVAAALKKATRPEKETP